MVTLKDFLVWYNNLDVDPFMEAAEIMATSIVTGVNVFKQCISIPGLTLCYVFQDLSDFFSLVETRDADMYTCLKDNIVRGPSIIFTRHHEAGVTNIRGGKVCQKIVGFDPNALYLACLASDMPAGHYARWLPTKTEGFFTVRRSNTHIADQLLEWQAHLTGVSLRHQGNHTEKRIGDRRLPVDGFAMVGGHPTVFEFKGCYWHAHECTFTRGRYNTRREKTAEDLRAEVLDNEAYIRALGYANIDVCECEFHAERQRFSALAAFLKTRTHPLHRYQTQTQQHLLDAVRGNALFGFVECDLHVPEHLKPTFAECLPIFKNTTVTRDDIGPHMKAYAEATGILTTPRRRLIGSMYGKKILLGTPLLRWYLNHGLIVTHIYQVMKYRPCTGFKPFADHVTEAHREGDTDPSKKLIGETMKM